MTELWERAVTIRLGFGREGAEVAKGEDSVVVMSSVAVVASVDSVVDELVVVDGSGVVVGSSATSGKRRMPSVECGHVAIWDRRTM